LKPVADVTTLVGGEKYATLSIVYPAYISLICFLKGSLLTAREPPVKALLRQTMFEGLEGRFSVQLCENSDERYWTYLLASFLDVRFKQLLFLEPSVRERVKLHII